jgi:hypothetical protein
MPFDLRQLRLQAADHVALTSARPSGFRLISMRPLFSVVLVPSTPMNDDRLSTAGSLRMTRPALLPLGHRGTR